MLVISPDVDLERRVVTNSPRDKSKLIIKGSISVMKCEIGEKG